MTVSVSVATAIHGSHTFVLLTSLRSYPALNLSESKKLYHIHQLNLKEVGSTSYLRKTTQTGHMVVLNNYFHFISTAERFQTNLMDHNKFFCEDQTQISHHSQLC